MKVDTQITKGGETVKEFKSTGTSAINKEQNFVKSVLPPTMEIYNYIRSNGEATIVTSLGYKVNFKKV